MAKFFLVLLIFVFIISHAVSIRSLNRDVIEMKEEHERWMFKYGRVYKDEDEKEHRMEIFKNNLNLLNYLMQVIISLNLELISLPISLMKSLKPFPMASNLL
ncbi:putative fruit bromelain [Dioscorea sansibarensis]